MKARYLHEHPEFSDLLRIVADDQSINDISLIEKDYWIMHCLYGLNLLREKLGIDFQLKGGSSLSKGYKIIDRFSEDIDIRIDPPAGRDVPISRNQDKKTHRNRRKDYYDWLCASIQIEGIISVERDEVFDDLPKYRSGGIRLRYPTKLKGADLKEGILLEVGFDNVCPNKPITISSWAYDYASDKVDIIDNRAHDILCYDPGYTFVEKLQAISTKFRKQEESGDSQDNFMRHYYDVYCLLGDPSVLNFISTDEYFEHKKRRFGNNDIFCIKENQAFIMGDDLVFEQYEKQYNLKPGLYYKGRPGFRDILDRIKDHIDRL